MGCEIDLTTYYYEFMFMGVVIDIYELVLVCYCCGWNGAPPAPVIAPLPLLKNDMRLLC